MHSMGNGECVAYGRGPEIPYFYGPPYSSPNILTLSIKCDASIKDNANREPGSAVWRHEITSADGPVMVFTEFVAADMPAYVRLIDCVAGGISWIIRPNPSTSFVPSTSVSGAWVQVIREGQPIFHYPSNATYCHWVILNGSCHGELNDKGEIIVTCLPGKGSVAIVGGLDYPSGVEAAERAQGEGAETLLDSTRDHWRKFTDRRLATRPLPHKVTPEVVEILDSIAVLLKSQQASGGGEMAGPYYALAYMRDQYGAARGMLALGMLDEARQNLFFRWSKYQRFGTLVTAEAMGSDCVRHQHENDEVEGPGYTILQTRDYIRAAGDDAFARKLWPMLEWCWNVQKRNLVDGMLQFSGDETYVAGGFFPRSGLIHGSADTTLVFAESGKWLVEWAKAQKLWTSAYAAEQMKSVDEARAAYRKRFWAKDRILANAPEREQMMTPPRFRHGVCEGVCGWFGWTERTRSGRYVCPYCAATKDMPAAAPSCMEVNSVSLLPAYLGSDILSREELTTLLDHVLKQVNDHGHIPSVPGTEGCVGYDPGLLLTNLTAVGHPAAKQAQDRLVRIVDQIHAWNEYYDGRDSVRSGCCRCRPWESGVNAEALVRYAEAGL